MSVKRRSYPVDGKPLKISDDETDLFELSPLDEGLLRAGLRLLANTPLDPGAMARVKLLLGAFRDQGGVE